MAQSFHARLRPPEHEVVGVARELALAWAQMATRPALMALAALGWSLRAFTRAPPNVTVSVSKV